VKAAAFSYRRPASLGEALAAAGGEARLMAGSQSLGPMLNLRLAEPLAIVDIRTLPELRTHRVEAGRLMIGAAVTHAEIEDGIVTDTTQGMLVHVARNIAYRAVRNRGTIGGSIAHADPAADWVNCMTALGATYHLAWTGGRRKVAAAEFMKSAYQTVMEAGEILVAVELPAFTPQMRWGYYKICTKVGEFASAIGAVVHDPGLGFTRVLIGAIEARPLVAPDLAGVLAMPPEAARETIAAAIQGALPEAGDVFVHQHAVALVRAVQQMNERQQAQ
jgi:carbon-monoxide dehydrogenase medium subunit